MRTETMNLPAPFRRSPAPSPTSVSRHLPSALDHDPLPDRTWFYLAEGRLDPIDTMGCGRSRADAIAARAKASAIYRRLDAQGPPPTVIRIEEDSEIEAFKRFKARTCGKVKEHLAFWRACWPLHPGEVEPLAAYVHAEAEAEKAAEKQYRADERRWKREARAEKEARARRERENEEARERNAKHPGIRLLTVIGEHPHLIEEVAAFAERRAASAPRSAYYVRGPALHAYVVGPSPSPEGASAAACAYIDAQWAEQVKEDAERGTHEAGPVPWSIRDGALAVYDRAPLIHVQAPSEREAFLTYADIAGHDPEHALEAWRRAFPLAEGEVETLLDDLRPRWSAR